MASVMLFPNVATHRRMPHLSKESKETTTPKPTVDVSLQQQQQQQRTATVLAPHSPPSTPSANIDRTDNTSNSSNTTHAQKAIGSTSTSSPAARINLLTLSTTSTTSHGSSKLVANGASSSSGSLLIDGTGGHSSLLSTPTGSDASTPLIDNQQFYHNGHQEQESLLHDYGHGHGRSHSDHSPLHLSLLHHNNQHHDKQQQQGHHPLKAPHGPPCISNSHQPLSGTTSCPSISTSASHESRLIKTALYDAFGCLYHPVQHTHSPSPCSPSVLCCGGQLGTSSKASMCASGSQVQAHVLRSGEVTPLISPSPRAMSPMLRPHLGLSSAPITPLELSSGSEDGISSISGSHGGGGAGYFGTVHGHGSGSGLSPSVGGGVGSSLSSSRQLHQHLSPNHHHHHHYQQNNSTHGQGHGTHQHPLPPVPQHHPSSFLNRTGSTSKRNHHTKHQQDETLLHSPSRPQHDPATSNGATLLSRKSSLGDIHLNPTEHPVLCSLQSLSLTHPHPANHYHPHLGHDLGHDRVSISSPPSGGSNIATVLPLTPSGALSTTMEKQ